VADRKGERWNTWMKAGKAKDWGMSMKMEGDPVEATPWQGVRFTLQSNETRI